MYIDEYAHWKGNYTMATDELIVEHTNDGVNIDLGSGKILNLKYPTVTLYPTGTILQVINIPPDMLISMEGDIIGRSFTDLSMERVAIVDWTVYSDNADVERWTVLSWVIARKGSPDEERYLAEGMAIMENTQRILEELLNVKN
jgi:hypothetical protein